MRNVTDALHAQADNAQRAAEPIALQDTSKATLVVPTSPAKTLARSLLDAITPDHHPVFRKNFQIVQWEDKGRYTALRAAGEDHHLSGSSNGVKIFSTMANLEHAACDEIKQKLEDIGLYANFKCPVLTKAFQDWIAAFEHAQGVQTEMLQFYIQSRDLAGYAEAPPPSSIHDDVVLPLLGKHDTRSTFFAPRIWFRWSNLEVFDAIVEDVTSGSLGEEPEYVQLPYQFSPALCDDARRLFGRYLFMNQMSLHGINYGRMTVPLS